MKLHFNIEWTDLKQDVKDGIIDSVMEVLLDEAKKEGKKLFKEKWHKPYPKNWKEAYVRYNGIESLMWEDYESGDAEKPKPDDWNYWLEEHFREMADDICYKSMHHMEIEVET
jgi:hypothetical protein